MNLPKQIERLELLRLFGLADKAKLPNEGIAEFHEHSRYPGWKFWIRPIVRATSWRRTHRIMAVHSCGQTVSAGRIGQHKCAAPLPLVRIPTPTSMQEVKELIG